MRILFDIGHPAHVHLFRNAAKILQARGHEVFFLARDKEVAWQLLTAYHIPFLRGSKRRKGVLGLGLEFWQWLINAYRVIRKNKINVVASIGSPAGAWAAKLNGVNHLAFNDTEISKKQRKLYYPASARVFSPQCLLVDYGPKHVRYNGLHDLAYLRPEQFRPDPGIRRELGLGPEEPYALLRFVSWDATHDWGQGGDHLANQFAIFKFASAHWKVFISAEGDLPEELDQYRLGIAPHRLHDVLAFAAVVVGDGATTATEAAVLGVPSIYISPFAESLGYLRFLTGYGLLKAVKTREEGLRELQAVLAEPELAKRKEKREQLLKETIDVAAFIADKCLEYAA